MFFIAYAFKGQVHVFAGQVKIVSHSSCRTSVILKYFCPWITVTDYSASEKAMIVCKLFNIEFNSGAELACLNLTRL